MTADFRMWDIYRVFQSKHVEWLGAVSARTEDEAYEIGRDVYAFSGWQIAVQSREEEDRILRGIMR